MTLSKKIFILPALGLLALVIMVLRSCDEDNISIPVGNYVKPVEKDTFRRNKTFEEVLPLRNEEVAGVLDVVVRDTVKAGDTVGTVKEIPIRVVIPRDGTPYVKIGKDSIGIPLGSSVTVEYTPFEDPLLDFRFDVLPGADVSLPIVQLSPVLNVTALQLFHVVRLGAGVDRFGFGPVAAWEVWREWNVVAKWNVVAFQEKRQAQIGIAYRL